MKCFSSAALPIRMVGAFAFVVSISLSVPAAPVCPYYMYGQMNGIYYYYGQDRDNNCNPGNFVGASDSRMHQIGATCMNCVDEIKLLNVAASVKPLKDDHVTVQPASKFKQTKYAATDEKFFSAGQHVTDAFEGKMFYVEDGDKKTRYFRVVKLELTIPGKPVIRVGQELDPKEGKKEKECTLEKVIDEDPTTKAGYHHRIKSKDAADPDEIYVTTAKEMKK